MYKNTNLYQFSDNNSSTFFNEFVLNILNTSISSNNIINSNIEHCDYLKDLITGYGRFNKSAQYSDTDRLVIFDQVCATFGQSKVVKEVVFNKTHNHLLNLRSTQKPIVIKYKVECSSNLDNNEQALSYADTQTGLISIECSKCKILHTVEPTPLTLCKVYS